ncbi:hypothetical protein AKJ44_02345 [candidate division MSBL1 archaeon SCGC-AAA261F17]|uniref:Uncharacterized protein n=1 Tax=candidate division MSBL1 archaeon SCGC-AAA261F17 TaxID=1698274 RepID=A0A133V5D9_9EURY|nr:hypothetical protein AKJ44_02345 [candidate division MSBL1 archaeon SCGC-AAA261F17]
MGKGGKVSYSFFPEFGSQPPNPPQVRHDRRRAVSGKIGILHPSMVGICPLWIETPDSGKYDLHVKWRVWTLNIKEGLEIPIKDLEKVFRIVVREES